MSPIHVNSPLRPALLSFLGDSPLDLTRSISQRGWFFQSRDGSRRVRLNSPRNGGIVYMERDVNHRGQGDGPRYSEWRVVKAEKALLPRYPGDAS